MTIALELLEAYVKCPTKCWLISKREPTSDSGHAQCVQARNEAYLASGVQRLLSETPHAERIISPSADTLKTGRWGLATNVVAKAQCLESHLHAVKRMPIAESEVYDPATNSFTTTGAMGTPRFAHTATLLPNGKVLIAGGFSTSNVGTFTENVLLTAELYDPAAGAFTPTGSLGTARGGHTATLLANGKVLVAGGLLSLNFAGVSVASTAELYDPLTGTFTLTGNLTAEREEHTATLLPDGRVLIVGGASASQGTLASAEIYDPATGSFTATDRMTTPRGAQTATLLPDGTVLVAGGNIVLGRHGTGLSQPTGTAELFQLHP